MTVYWEVVVALNAAVDFLLLIGCEHLSGHPPRWRRLVLAALLGGVYAGVCLLPGCRFLGNLLWRVVALGLMGVVAFGRSRSALGRVTVFLLLSFALGGVVMLLQKGVLLSALLVVAVAVLGLRNRPAGGLVPVELSCGDKTLRCTALRDTGNLLRDPITGERVLVAGPEVARQLLGWTPAQLRDPVGTLAAGKVPGARLIPYRSVGEAGSMLLAVRCPRVTVGNWSGGMVVAFSPVEIGQPGSYELLIGGALG